MDKIEPVAAYIRVSSQEQRLHGLSLDAQRMKLSDYAASHNMHIVDWYEDEGVSGRKLIRNRPELQRMIQDAEAKRFDRIIFIKLDRFFRSVAEYHECMKRISPVVWSTTEEEYDLTTANGRMLVNMKLTIAELEADQTGERIKIVNDYKVKSGLPLSGSVPFCFCIEMVDGKKRIVKNHAAEHIMQDLLHYLMQYQCKRKATIYINQKYGLEITPQRLNALVENPMLHGEYRGNPDFLRAEDRYLTKEEHDRLISVLSRQVKDNTAVRSYIFAGLIKCPRCGRRLTGNARRKQRQKGVVEEKLYRCPKRWVYGCCEFGKNISENTMERLLLENIRRFVDDAEAASIASVQEESAVLKRSKVEGLRAELDRLNYAWQKGRIPFAEKYDSEYERITREIVAAESQLAASKTFDLDKVKSKISGDWITIYTSLDDSHKQAFWRSFIESIEVIWTDDIKMISRVNFF